MQAIVFYTNAYRSFFQKLTAGSRPAAVALARVSFLRKIGEETQRLDAVMGEIKKEFCTEESLASGGMPVPKEGKEEDFMNAIRELQSQDIVIKGFTIEMLGNAELGPIPEGGDDSLVAEAFLQDNEPKS